MTLEKVVSDLIRLNDIDLVLNYETRFLEIADLLSGWLDISADRKKFFQDKQSIEANSLLYNPLNSKEMVLDLKEQEKTEKGVSIKINHLGKIFEKSINYGGHPSQFNQWAGNHILNLLREIILSEKALNG